ncbi:MAG: hypothetical protein CMK74_20185 [Pseudomonadales bacterium]|nr:hypothetical protein [Pseudomonadales bacterium]|tara:strand:+ start:852 stop:1244 length:393 start_codon:yes stop_codon:yes gene_type:complete
MTVVLRFRRKAGEDDWRESQQEGLRFIGTHKEDKHSFKHRPDVKLTYDTFVGSVLGTRGRLSGEPTFILQLLPIVFGNKVHIPYQGHAVGCDHLIEFRWSTISIRDHPLSFKWRDICPKDHNDYTLPEEK